MRKVSKPNLIYDQFLRIRVWLNVLAGFQLAPSEPPTKNTADCWVWSRLNPSLTSCHLGSGAWPEIARVSCSCPRAIFKFESRGGLRRRLVIMPICHNSLFSSVSMAGLRHIPRFGPFLGLCLSWEAAIHMTLAQFATIVTLETLLSWAAWCALVAE